MDDAAPPEAAPPGQVRSLIDEHRDTLQRLIAESDGSESGRLRARRAAALATWLDNAELLMAQGRAIDMDTYLRTAALMDKLLADTRPPEPPDASVTAAANLARFADGSKQSNMALARAICLMHYEARQSGTLHLLPPEILDIAAKVTALAPEPEIEPVDDGRPLAAGRNPNWRRGANTNTPPTTIQ